MQTDLSDLSERAGALSERADAAPGRARGPSRQTLLTFRLQGELFALPVERVHEIIDPLPMTRVPRAPELAPGLINVRGSVVPVVDVRRRLEMPPATPGEESRMVVLDVEIEQTVTKLAIVADGVDKVIEIEASEIEAVPEIGLRWPARFLAGVAQRAGDLIVLLRPETAFDPAPARSAGAH